MVGYVTLGTNDLDKAVAFYDALLTLLGAKQVINDDRMVVWAGQPGAMLAVCKPHDGTPATVGNGVMVALAAGSNEGAKNLYRKAIELGATDEGEPGPRSGSFYGGYFRDLDGNKLVAFHVGG